MKTLTIFHDPRCGLCVKFRAWLEVQPKRVAVEFLDFDSREAKERFPLLEGMDAGRDLVVMADDGNWWQGTPAWLTCLWTTSQYRDWSFRLASPVFQPFVKKAVHLLSENRLTLSRMMKLKGDTELASAIHSLPEAKCQNGSCHI